MTEPPFDRTEAARRLGMKESWLKAHPEVPHFRVGRLLRYTQNGLDLYLARQFRDPDAYVASQRSRPKR